ncbi:putative fatty acyl-CoA reductase CG5065 [Cydia strobilella]|uniref:putative fatty acyl-CoA reductase CG5065 n=1 Tax=Cydia strobilella TaxID=1100964 RepID=UPI0030043A75
MGSTTNERTSVAGFFEGKSVFITGVTGFLGKALLEKLLYSCIGIDKIYVLMRPKKGLSLTERVQNISNSLVFQRLKSNRPEDMNKIIPVTGDLSAPGLGLSAKDEEDLLNNVSVVFHSAATVKMNEPLRVALAVNLEGTIKVLALCKRMRNIRAFVYVSTAYTNTDQQVVEERVYPPPANIDAVYKFLREHGDDKEATKIFLNGRPNTYSFSKSLAEAYLAEHHGDVPTVILRPSIVGAARSEPLAGWVDAWQGNTILQTNVARGFLRVLFCDAKVVADLIPLDCVVNMAIVSVVHSKQGKVSVYNCCTSEVNPMTWRMMSELFLRASKADNFHKVPFPGVVMTRSPVKLAVGSFCLMTVPAYVLDAWRMVKRKPSKYRRLNRQLYILQDNIKFFTTHNWVMRSAGACALAEALTDADARLFPCHPAHVHWPSYMAVYYRGIKEFLCGGKK